MLRPSLSDPRGIHAFLAVVEEGSFRAAARVLDLPKSTVSQRVAELEQQLGVRLLARTTRTVRLTDIGASFRADVLPAMEALRHAEARVTALQATPTGQLRVTAPFEFGQHLFGRVLARFGEACPQVRVTLDLLDRHVNLVEEGYDLALRVGPLQESTLIARRIGSRQRMGIYASASYLQAHDRPETPAELSDHRCLVMTGAREPTVWPFVDGRRQRRVTVAAYMAANSFVVLAQLARAGLGIARMPSRYFVADPEPLEELLEPFAPPARDAYAVYPGGRFVSPALREMLRVVTEEADCVQWGDPPG